MLISFFVLQFFFFFDTYEVYLYYMIVCDWMFGSIYSIYIYGTPCLYSNHDCSLSARLVEGGINVHHYCCCERCRNPRDKLSSHLALFASVAVLVFAPQGPRRERKQQVQRALACPKWRRGMSKHPLAGKIRLPPPLPRDDTFRPGYYRNAGHDGGE